MCLPRATAAMVALAALAALTALTLLALGLALAPQGWLSASARRLFLGPKPGVVLWRMRPIPLIVVILAMILTMIWVLSKTTLRRRMSSRFPVAALCSILLPVCVGPPCGLTSSESSRLSRRVPRTVRCCITNLRAVTSWCCSRCGAVGHTLSMRVAEARVSVVVVVVVALSPVPVVSDLVTVVLRVLTALALVWWREVAPCCIVLCGWRHALHLTQELANDAP
mmetsp:Transcript_36230/g.96260  ORF Transcript_36230/g.96260 Transcript_36230/m.96260 type:complete len:224 (-) Transcript_36230:657-1328(-)